MRDEQRGEDHEAIVGGIDEWDEYFLNEAIQVELEATSSRNSRSNQLDQTPLDSCRNPDPNFPPFPSYGFTPVGANGASEHSPPRVFSQRPPDEPIQPFARKGVFSQRPPDEPIQSFARKGGGVKKDEEVEILKFSQRPIQSFVRNGGGVKKDEEVEILKRELERVSKQLNHMEHECMELKNDRSIKDEQLKNAFSQIEAKDFEIHSLKREKLGTSKGDLLQSSWQRHQCPVTEGEFSLDFQHPHKTEENQSDGTCAVSRLKRRKISDNNLTTAVGGSIVESTSYEIPAQLKCTKAIAIQTDLAQANNPHASTDLLTMEHKLSNKLLAIWGSPIINSSTCYKRTGREMVSKLFVTCSEDFFALFSCMRVGSEIVPISSVDKSFSNMAPLDAAASVQSTNATKVARLREILMKVHNEVALLPDLLKALLDVCTLDNVSLVHRSLRILHAILQYIWHRDIRSDSRNNIIVDQSLEKTHENKGGGGLDKASGSFSLNTRSFDIENIWKDEKGCSSHNPSFSSEKLISLFETMRQIAMRKSEEYIQIEAISIMSLILIRNDTYLEREMFGLNSLLQMMACVLREHVGLHVRLQAVRLLFLLLNCPKMLMMFSRGHKDDSELKEVAHVQGDESTLQKEISCVLNGLSECLACGGSGAQGLKLRRQVIVLLAYIATCSKSGFEILLGTETPKRLNFLVSIVRVLASEIDAELANAAEAQSLSKERCSLMREALILLNRLASHPAYSKPTMGALTRGSAAFDVANRLLYWKGRGADGGTKKTQMDAEIVDLARIFRTRLYGFLGESSTS